MWLVKQRPTLVNSISYLMQRILVQSSYTKNGYSSAFEESSHRKNVFSVSEQMEMLKQLTLGLY